MGIDLPCLEALFGDPEADIPGLVLLWAALCIKATDFIHLCSVCSRLTAIIDFHHFSLAPALGSQWDRDETPVDSWPMG
jgi:hypothetical protein